jgi:predicted alpha/beta superfamily hydrolase
VTIMHRSNAGCLHRLPFLIALALGGCAPSTPAVLSPRIPGTSQASPAADPIPPHDTFSVRSRALGEVRAINVWTPPGYDRAPTRHWPVLYMPDGGLDEDFPHVVNTVDSLMKRGAIRPVIVVGIPNTQRRRDLTGPTKVKGDSAIAAQVGGSAAFRAFIREELIPTVEARYRTTSERGIIGESLAGLFVLETFFTEPTLFTHYAAIDPSLWWNDEALVNSVAVNIARMNTAPRTLYLTTANYAETATAAARITTQLRAASPPGLQWIYVPRPDLTHATIFRGTQADVLTQTLR